jgi:hypothetical protein
MATPALTVTDVPTLQVPAGSGFRLRRTWTDDSGADLPGATIHVTITPRGGGAAVLTDALATRTSDDGLAYGVDIAPDALSEGTTYDAEFVGDPGQATQRTAWCVLEVVRDGAAG